MYVVRCHFKVIQGDFDGTNDVCDGLPDASQVILANLSPDRDGDGIPNWLDQYPDTSNTTYNSQTSAADVPANMATLGFGGASDTGHGPIVGKRPRGHLLCGPAAV